METTLSLISQFPVKKVDRELFIEKSLDMILDGTRQITQYAELFASMEKIVSSIRTNKRFETALQKEIEKHGKSADFENSKMVISETGVSYDFSTSNKWNALDRLKESVIEERKEVEQFLKTIKEKITIVDEQTGETIEISPVVKTSKTKVIVTLK